MPHHAQIDRAGSGRLVHVWALGAALLLGACDMVGAGGSTAETDTNMKSVEIQPGTASDEMILLDQSNVDGTAVDPSSAVGPPAPVTQDSPDAGADSSGNASAGGSSSGNSTTQGSSEPAGGDGESGRADSQEQGE